MHELFLTASVPGDNVKETLKILQGLCGLKPVHKYERILTFEGPQSLLVAVPASRIQNRRPQDREPWNELNKQLIRQSYYINLVYPVGQSQFGRNAGEADDQSPIKP
jgi:mediator of RNA polymerase II transcription subunit 18